MRPVRELPNSIDPIIDFRMKGCYTDALNLSAGAFFAAATARDLSAMRPYECFCLLVWGPNAYMSSLCPLEVAYESLAVAKGPIGTFYPAQFRRPSGSNRSYFLFRTHLTREPGANRLRSRFLLLPRQIKLVFTSENVAGESGLFPVRWRIETLNVEGRFEEKDLKHPVAGSLLYVPAFFATFNQSFKRRRSTLEAWKEVTSIPEFMPVAADMPESVVSMLTSDPDSARVMQILDQVQRDPLDAPAFMAQILPVLEDELRNRPEKFLPGNASRDEIRQAARLPLTLSELEQEDQKLQRGWLPLDSDPRGTRERLRSGTNDDYPKEI
jgi:hypothetical protein